MKKNQRNNYLKETKNNTRTFKFFLKVMLIAFIPIIVINILLGYLFKGNLEWLLWLITFVLFVIAGVIGLVIDSKLTKKEMEEKQNAKKMGKGKAVPKIEDIDIFGEQEVGYV